MKIVLRTGASLGEDAEKKHKNDLLVNLMLNLLARGKRLNEREHRTAAEETEEILNLEE